MVAEPGRAVGLPRMLRLWALAARMDLLFIARSVKLALSFYVADILIGSGMVATTFLLTERFGAIGGWTRPGLLFLLAYGLLVRALTDSCFGFNISHISR